jgi:hypothetical protein
MAAGRVGPPRVPYVLPNTDDLEEAVVNLLEMMTASQVCMVGTW